jgi:hypothetical protein
MDGIKSFENLKATPERGFPETLTKVSKRIKIYKRNIINKKKP